MKIGIVLTGVSYGKRVGERFADRDWRDTAENIEENLIIPFEKQHEISLYLTTYNNFLIEDLINFYQPKKTLILPWANSHQRTTYYESLKQVIDEDLDFIISTRFDVKFNSPVTDYPFQYDKFNFTFREIEPYWSQNKYVNDVLFSFPPKYLKHLLLSIIQEQENPVRLKPDLHNMYSHMIKKIGEQNIHFLFEGLHDSSDNPFYQLVRKFS